MDLTNITTTVDWTEKRLEKVLILRFDVSGDDYILDGCIGQLTGGELVHVEMPFDKLPKRTWKTAVIDIARKAKVYCRDLNLFNAVSINKVPTEAN